MKRIAIEGMPGAGKTSTATRILETLPEEILLLSELNPPPHILRGETELSWKDYHFLWKERLDVLVRFKNEMRIIFDRSFYSNLAYTYAIEDMEGYCVQKRRIQTEFSDDFFDTIIALIAEPNIGIERRLTNQDIPPVPWNNLKFLKRLLSFYIEELPKIYKGKLIFLDTTKKSPDQVMSWASKYITPQITSYIVSNNKKMDESIESKLLFFGKKEKLGNPYTKAIYVMGIPTLYFRQYALQFINKEVTYFDTNQLSKLLGGFQEHI